MKSGKIVGVQTNIRSSITEEGQAKQLHGDSIAWAKAVFRNRVINPDQHDDEEQQKINGIINTVPERTDIHWKRLYREAEVRYGSGILGLLPDYHNCGGTKKIPTETRELIHAVLDTHYNTITRKPKRGAYGEFELQCEEKNIPRRPRGPFMRRRAVTHQSMMRSLRVKEHVQLTRLKTIFGQVRKPLAAKEIMPGQWVIWTIWK